MASDTEQDVNAIREMTLIPIKVENPDGLDSVSDYSDYEEELNHVPEFQPAEIGHGEQNEEIVKLRQQAQALQQLVEVMTEDTEQIQRVEELVHTIQTNVTAIASRNRQVPEAEHSLEEEVQNDVRRETGMASQNVQDLGVNVDRGPDSSRPVMRGLIPTFHTLWERLQGSVTRGVNSVQNFLRPGEQQEEQSSGVTTPSTSSPDSPSPSSSGSDSSTGKRKREPDEGFPVPTANNSERAKRKRQETKDASPPHQYQLRRPRGPGPTA